MRVIAVVSRKGGAGKTTLTAHLAVAAEASGHGPVAVIDTDPQDGLAGWWNARQTQTPLWVDPVDGLPAASVATKKAYISGPVAVRITSKFKLPALARSCPLLRSSRRWTRRLSNKCPNTTTEGLRNGE